LYSHDFLKFFLVCLFFSEPPDGDSAGVSCDGDAHVEGGFDSVGAGAFGDDDEDGEDEHGNVLPQPLFGSSIGDPVASHDGLELSKEHQLLLIDLLYC